MNQLRLLEPGFGDSVESAIRHFLSPWSSELDSPALRMRIDVKESPQAYAIEADLPGVNKEDIEVRVHGNVVQIDAEVKRESKNHQWGQAPAQRTLSGQCLAQLFPRTGR